MPPVTYYDYNGSGWRVQSLAGISRPSDTILFADADGATPDVIGAVSFTRENVCGQLGKSPDCSRLRHQANRFMAGFVDGHVKFISVDESIRPGSGGASDILWNAARP